MDVLLCYLLFLELGQFHGWKLQLEMGEAEGSGANHRDL
jgi:hypothetical protein